MGDELRDVGPNFGREASLYIYLGCYATPAASAAHAVIPTGAFAEGEGTFTNHEGRVQRFWPGVRGPAAARPAWLVLGTLVERLGGAQAPAGVEDAFLRAADLAAEFQGLTYESIGTRGALCNEPLAIPGRAS
jgi:predicted molibdopterin-dependent oxidoreductase YjgC